MTTPAPVRLKCANSLALHSFTLSLVDATVSEIQKIPEWKAKRLDSELSKSVLKLVRDQVHLGLGSHLSYSQASSIDKRALAAEALRKAFDLNADEVALVESQMDFLLDNNLVRRHVLSFVLRGIWSLLPKRFRV